MLPEATGAMKKNLSHRAPQVAHVRLASDGALLTGDGALRACRFGQKECAEGVRHELVWEL